MSLVSLSLGLGGSFVVYKVFLGRRLLLFVLLISCMHLLVREHVYINIYTYTTTKYPILSSVLKSFSVTHLYYISSILSLLHREPICIILILDSEYTFASFFKKKICVLL
jgi:hypothetical protein